jgi:hypothetical protein
VSRPVVVTVRGFNGAIVDDRPRYGTRCSSGGSSTDNRCRLAAGDGAVDSRSGHAEQITEFGGAVFAAAQQLDQVRFLAPVELGLLSAQVTLGLRHSHALASTRADQVGLNYVDNRPTSRP